MEPITLTGRNSRLSRLQIETVKQHIEAAFPEIEVKVKTRSTRGDDLQHIPLQTVEGTDFFTEEIYRTLETGEADIAVHSLKDLSSQHYFGENYFSVVDRVDSHDVALFQKDIISKIRSGKEIIIGTCSPRREVMALDFLQKALPQLHPGFLVKSKVIRGNVDTRLLKLDSGEFDGIILAAAGINRLLNSPSDSVAIKNLLKNKRLMVLPLVECVPAPCQGAIVAEAFNQNKRAIAILEKINNNKLLRHCQEEKKIALRYGAGCDQKFGVTTVEYGDNESFFSSGTDEKGETFEDWFNLPTLNSNGKTIFDVSEVNKELFDVEFVPNEIEIKHPVVFVASTNAVHGSWLNELQSRRVWAAGTKTWLNLAKKGIWVEGCADVGLESLSGIWCTPMVNISREAVMILTNESAAANWEKKGWGAQGTYKVLRNSNWPEEKMALADIIFWTGIQQYQNLKHLVKKDAVHVCPHGETAALLKDSGVQPVIFPTIKAFKQWKK